ncbi:MAG: Cell division protein MraZ, partial [uncultured Blastococcus sp.]
VRRQLPPASRREGPARPPRPLPRPGGRRHGDQERAGALPLRPHHGPGLRAERRHGRHGPLRHRAGTHGRPDELRVDGRDRAGQDRAHHHSREPARIRRAGPRRRHRRRGHPLRDLGRDQLGGLRGRTGGRLRRPGERGDADAVV